MNKGNAVRIIAAMIFIALSIFLSFGSGIHVAGSNLEAVAVLASLA